LARELRFVSQGDVYFRDLLDVLTGK
jgi:hypothetical protein